MGVVDYSLNDNNGISSGRGKRNNNNNNNLAFLL
jgi:hypothetical protein